MTKKDRIPERLWEKPESGYKEFDDRFNRYYDEAESQLRDNNPKWFDKYNDIKDNHKSDLISTSCDIAERQLKEWLWQEHQAIMIEQKPFIITCPGEDCSNTETFNCIKCYSATHNDQYNDPFEPFKEPVMCMNCGTTYHIDMNLQFTEK